MSVCLFKGPSPNQALEKLRQRAKLAHAQTKLERVQTENLQAEAKINALEKALEIEKAK